MLLLLRGEAPVPLNRRLWDVFPQLRSLGFSQEGLGRLSSVKKFGFSQIPGSLPAEPDPGSLSALPAERWGQKRGLGVGGAALSPL